MYPYDRRRGRKSKGTRPFMPVYGKRPRRRQDVPAGQTGGEADGVAAGSASDAGEAASADLQQLRQERDAYLDMARRERADFDNYRKRVEREREVLKRDSLAGFLKEFFGPLDDLERVLAESAKSHSYESLVTGVRLTEENLWRALAKAGVTRMDAKGKPFDPARHEAMAMVPSADVAPNTVIEVYDNGYMLDDHVLRPARVVVSREPEGV